MKRIGAVVYKDTPDARQRFAELGLDTDYEDTFSITLNGTDTNGQFVVPRYVQVDNFDNIAPVVVTINGINNSVAPYTRTTFEIPHFTPDVGIFAYEGNVKIYISEARLGIGDGTNDLAKDGAFNMGTYYPRDGSVPMLADFDFGTFLGRNLKDPVALSDAVNLSTLYLNTYDVKKYGAKFDGVTGDGSAIRTALTQNNAIKFPVGTTIIDEKITTNPGNNEMQKPIHIIGWGFDTMLIVDNVDDKCFRFAAVGGLALQPLRKILKMADFGFSPKVGRVAPYAITCIELQSVHSATLQDLLFLNMGPGAVNFISQYYGYSAGLQFCNSGISMSDTNSHTFLGCEWRADDRAVIDGGEGANAGQALFAAVNRYPIELVESDQIKFFGGLIEGWARPFALLRGSFNHNLNGVWIEGNPSTTHCIKWEQSQTLTLNECQLDFAVPYSLTGSFILIDMLTPSPTSARQYFKPSCKINGGYLLLTSAPFGDTGKIAKTVNGEIGTIHLDNKVEHRGGCLYADRGISFDVKSIVLVGGDNRHLFYSKPNAALEREYNSWMPDSLHADWDFAVPAITGAGLIVTQTVAANQFKTGTRGLKITGFGNGTTKTFSHVTTADMPAIANDKQSYLSYISFKFNQNVDFTASINGGFADFFNCPTLHAKANEWVDLVFKTDMASTWAQGRFAPPEIKYTVTNNSGAAAECYIDREDYKICTGDHII